MNILPPGQREENLEVRLAVTQRRIRQYRAYLLREASALRIGAAAELAAEALLEFDALFPEVARG